MPKLGPNYHKMNELEMAFDLVRRALSDRVGGVVFNRGEEIESRLSYAKALEVMNSLEVHFAVTGRFSFSICKTCDHWNPRTCQQPNFGTCGDKYKHAYETCVNHTPNKETWGL